MQEIYIIILSLLTLTLWIEGTEYLLSSESKIKIPWLNRLAILYPKPLFCSKCIGFWLSLLIIFITLNPIYFLIYITNLIIIKIN